MIPPGISDILHHLILRKTSADEIIKDWKNKDGICRQCNKVIKTFSHIFECEVVKEYLDNISTHLRTSSVF